MSDDRHYFILDTQVGRSNAKACIDNTAEGFVCEVRKRRRLEVQNAKFHAMLGDICKQWLFNGRRLVPSEAKVLFISAHAVATKEGRDLVTGLEGELVNLRESSADMTLKRMGSLIEYTSAWCNMNGVRLSAPSWYDER